MKQLDIVVCDRHDVLLLVVFGSTVTSAVPDEAHDLDVAVHGGMRFDVRAFLAALTDLTYLDVVDLLDLRRAGAVAAVEALQHGDVLVERPSGLADRLLIRATLGKMDTQSWREPQKNDARFCDEVAQGLAEAADPAIDRVSHGQVVSSWRQQRADLERRGAGRTS